MVPWRASADGEVTPKLIEWYARFAAGKPGALVIEATGIRDIPSGPLLRIGHDRYVEGLTQLTKAVKEASTGFLYGFCELSQTFYITIMPNSQQWTARNVTDTGGFNDECSRFACRESSIPFD